MSDREQAIDLAVRKTLYGPFLELASTGFLLTLHLFDIRSEFQKLWNESNV